MAIRNEDLRVNIIIGGDPVQKKMLENERATKALSDSLRETRDKMAALRKEGKSNTDEFKKLAATEKELESKIKANRAEFDRLNQSVGVNHKTISQLRKEIRQTNIALSQAAPGGENFRRLNEQLRQLQTRLREVSAGAGQTRSMLQRLGSVKAGAVAAFAAVAAGVRAVANAFSSIAEFEQANANLSTILGTTVDRMKLLTETAKSLGRSTEYTASQVTELQTELAKLGFKEPEIMAMQEPVLHFATALGTNLPEAAALAGATLRMFGLRASDTEDTLSVLTAGANRSALSFSYYQTAMSIVGPVAKTFNFSLRDTVALLGTLANSGFDASSAATATRNILLNLADSSGKLATALGGPVKTFPELMDGLRKLDEQGIDLATTLDLTDKRSVSAFNTFLSGADSAVELRGELENLGDVLKDTAEARLDTVEGSVKKLQSAWEGLMLSLSGSKGAVKNAIDALTDLIYHVNLLIDPTMRESEAWGRGLEEYVEVGYDPNAYIGTIREMAEKEIEEAEKQLEEAETRAEHRRARRRLKRANQSLEGLNIAAAPYEGGSVDMSATTGGATTTTTTVDADENNGGDKKSKKQWSLESDESYLKARNELTKMYNEGDIASKEDYERQLFDLEVSSLTARLALHKESGADREKIEKALQDAIMKRKEKDNQEADKLAREREKLEKEGAEIIAAAETDKTKAAEAAEEARYQAELKKFKETETAYSNQAAVIEAIERRHQAALDRIRLEGFDKEISEIEAQYRLNKQTKEAEYTQQIADAPANSVKRAKISGEKDNALAVLDLDYLQKLSDKLNEVIEKGTVDGISVSLDSDQLVKYKQRLEEVKQKISEITQTQKDKDNGWLSGAGGGSLFGVSQEQWAQLFANLQNGENKAQSLATILNGIGGAAQEGFAIASEAISMTTAKENAALKKYEKNNEKRKTDLQQRLDAGLVSESQYNAEVEQMDAEYEAYKEELALKQAKREKALKVSQAIMDTALSVTKTMAAYGNTPVGWAAAAVAAALGAAKTALIISTPVTSGAEEGGDIFVKREQDGRKFKARLSPDKRGFVSSPTVIVGENGSEYVIPADGVANPSLRPVIATMETARKNGTLRDLDFSAVYPSYVAQGRASGGYTSPPPEASGSSVSAQSIPAVLRQDPELTAEINRLNRILSSGIRSSVSMLGEDGFVRSEKKYNRIRKRGRA